MSTDALQRHKRFDQYINLLSSGLGHKDRLIPFKSYCTGLLLPGDRKSVEPMAARTCSGGDVRRAHQSLHHFVASAPWKDLPILKSVVEYVMPGMKKHGGIFPWIVDDTGIPKKGSHSVGVTRQYCGILGKQDNCQVAVSLSFANQATSIPVAYDLYLPETWTGDLSRRHSVGVPKDVVFKRKWEISLAQIELAKNAGNPVATVVADAGYGNITEFRLKLREMNLDYMVGIQTSTGVWPSGSGPLPPLPKKENTGRPRKNLHRTPDHQPISVVELAAQLPNSSFRKVTWREGCKGNMQSRFAAIRVRAAHRDFWRSKPHPEEWLLIEWPEGEKEPSKYWLSSLPENLTRKKLVEIAMIRWRIEHDYEELKSEIGLDHFEGRSWRGFYHHGTLCIAAYGFLVAERLRFSPLRDLHRKSLFEKLSIPENYIARGSPNEQSTET